MYSICICGVSKLILNTNCKDIEISLILNDKEWPLPNQLMILVINSWFQSTQGHFWAFVKEKEKELFINPSI